MDAPTITCSRTTAELLKLDTRPRIAGQYRQGDVLLRRIARLPGRTRTLAHGVVVDGKHPHRVLAPAQLLQRGAEVFVRVPAGGADLVHEEHATIRLPEGLFVVVRQRIFAPELRRVVD